MLGLGLGIEGRGRGTPQHTRTVGAIRITHTTLGVPYYI